MADNGAEIKDERVEDVHEDAGDDEVRECRCL